MDAKGRKSETAATSGYKKIDFICVNLCASLISES
jgi:hypothetical protein